MMSQRNQSEGDRKCAKYLKDYFPPKFTYQDFGPMLTMDFFDAEKFADIVADSGAKYLVFTSKHHDGFCNWPSTYTYGWNSEAIGPKRNVLGELKQAFKDKHPDIHFGLYYSLYEWFNPLYLKDQANKKETRNYPLHKMLPEMKELVETFEPHVWWSDGDWEAHPEFWGSQEFLAWLYNESPVKDMVVTNDRWGVGCAKKHGGYYSGPDRFNPGTLQAHKWENAMTVDRQSWGIRRNINIADVFSPEELIKEIASTVSCGGNILINVGPTKEGTIIPIFQERLHQLGRWLRINGEAIYGTRPWTHQNDSNSNVDVWYTKKNDLVYGIILQWPEDDVLIVSKLKVNVGESKISLVLSSSEEESLKFHQENNEVKIRYPSMSKVFAKTEGICQYATVLKFEHVSPSLSESEPSVNVLY